MKKSESLEIVTDEIHMLEQRIEGAKTTLHYLRLFREARHTYSANRSEVYRDRMKQAGKALAVAQWKERLELHQAGDMERLIELDVDFSLVPEAQIHKAIAKCDTYLDHPDNSKAYTVAQTAWERILWFQKVVDWKYALEDRATFPPIPEEVRQEAITACESYLETPNDEQYRATKAAWDRALASELSLGSLLRQTRRQIGYSLQVATDFPGAEYYWTLRYTELKQLEKDNLDWHKISLLTLNWLLGEYKRGLSSIEWLKGNKSSTAKAEQHSRDIYDAYAYLVHTHSDYTLEQVASLELRNAIARYHATPTDENKALIKQSINHLEITEWMRYEKMARDSPYISSQLVEKTGVAFDVYVESPTEKNHKSVFFKLSNIYKTLRLVEWKEVLERVPVSSHIDPRMREDALESIRIYFKHRHEHYTLNSPNSLKFLWQSEKVLSHLFSIILNYELAGRFIALADDYSDLQHALLRERHLTLTYFLESPYRPQNRELLGDDRLPPYYKDDTIRERENQLKDFLRRLPEEFFSLNAPREMKHAFVDCFLGDESKGSLWEIYKKIETAHQMRITISASKDLFEAVPSEVFRVIAELAIASNNLSPEEMESVLKSVFADDETVNNIILLFKPPAKRSS